MTTMKATKKFTGPKGVIQEGQIVDVNPQIAASWQRQGIATPVGSKRKSVKDKMLHNEKTEDLGSGGNDDPGNPPPNENVEPKPKEDSPKVPAE